MPEIEGNLIFAFSEENGNYHIFYDEELAQGPGYNRLVGALFKMMKTYPELVEEVLQAALRASEDLSKPFNEILNERPSKN